MGSWIVAIACRGPCADVPSRPWWSILAALEPRRGTAHLLPPGQRLSLTLGGMLRYGHQAATWLAAIGGAISRRLVGHLQASVKWRPTQSDSKSEASVRFMGS